MVGQGDFVTLQQQLHARLQAFDDEALIALANRGLFRRAGKDLELQEPQIIDDSSALRLRLGAQQLEFSSADPSAGRCDCKAGGVCHHLLAALLWLRRLPPASATVESAEAVTAPQAMLGPADAEALLLSFDDEALKKFAGSAGFRWALSYVLDLNLEREFVFTVTRYPILRLPRLQFELRCIGNTLAEFIAAGGENAARYTVAAILAYQRQCGLTLPKLEQHASDAVDAATRKALLEQICQFAIELATLGLTHLSNALCERNLLLASRAQAHGCYRLAARLRRCGEQMEAALARMAHSDSAALLDELAFVYTLAQGLLHALGEGRWPSLLVGQARQDYDETDTLALLGLAAWPFQSASGFSGLSVLFYATDANEFLTLTEARPAALGFDPIARFRQFGPWRGMSSPQAVMGHALQVQHARRAGYRLSAHEQTTVLAQSGCTAAAWLALPRITDWRLLSPRASASIWLSGGEDYALLQPSQWQAAQFDPRHQQLNWTLFDEQNAGLSLSLPYSELHARAVSGWEHFSQTVPTGQSLIVVRLRDGRVEPVGWLQHDGASLAVGTPFFRDSADNAKASVPTEFDHFAEHPELNAWRQFLLLHAERGLSAAWTEALEQRRARAQAHGLLKLASLASGACAPEVLLRCWVYLEHLSSHYRNLMTKGE